VTPTRAERWVLTACVLLALGAYAQTASYQFVYDDLHVIQDKVEVHSLANWRELLTRPLWFDLYRPVSELSLALDWTVSKGSPGYFHVVNGTLHAGVSVLVYLLARGALGVVGAGAAALLFAVHPVHVEAVANLVGRAELLAALFTLLAALAYRADGRLAAAGDRTWRRGAASFGMLAALALGVASKETALVTPGVLLLMDWLEGERTGESAVLRFRRHWVLWAGAVALSMEWLWVRTSVVGGLGGVTAPGLQAEGLWGRSFAMAPVVLQYVRLFFFPVRLSADYSPDFLPVVPAPTLRGAAGLAVVVIAAAVALRQRHRAPPIAFGLAWMAGTLLIVSNLIVPSEVLLAERTLYLPSVGAVLVLGWLAAWSEASWRYAGVGLAALGVGLGLARTVTRVPVWRDDDRFFPQLVRDAPGSYRSYWMAGILAYQAGDRARGETLVKHALVVYPLHPGVWQTLGDQQTREGRWLEAARNYRIAFRLDSTEAANGFFAARSYVRAGLMDSAAALTALLQAKFPYNVWYQSSMAELEGARGHPLAAMTWWRRVAWQLPDSWEAWYMTARTALEAGYCWEARRSTGRVRALRPGLRELQDLQSQIGRSGCAQ
jgi:tetratricopeptide (TPR) repeat protein